MSGNGPRIVPADIPESPIAAAPGNTTHIHPDGPHVHPGPQEITTFAPSAEVGQALELLPEEKARVYAVEARKNELRGQVGNIEAQKFGLLVALRDAEQQSMALAIEIAKAHGIDSADMSKGWNFDAGRGCITRTK